MSQPPPSVGETQRRINNERRLQLLMSNPSCMYTTHVNVVVHRGDAGAADGQTHKRRRKNVSGGGTHEKKEEAPSLSGGRIKNDRTK